MDVRAYNKFVWDRNVEKSNRWTVPVDSDTIAKAKQGQWQVVLTENKPVPDDWFPNLNGLDVLCLASGGGQQVPVLAAAGANVTSFDNSLKQLEQDWLIAEREALQIKTVEGDMADLSLFANESFDIVFHPVSNLFVPDIRPVWKEAYRVLRHGGLLMSGFVNPIEFIFDLELLDEGEFKVRHSLPYSDLTSLTNEERQRLIDDELELVFGHTLQDQIGGQLESGFMLTAMYEDYKSDSELSKYTPLYIATRSLKP